MRTKVGDAAQLITATRMGAVCVYSCGESEALREWRMIINKKAYDSAPCKWRTVLGADGRSSISRDTSLSEQDRNSNLPHPNDCHRPTGKCTLPSAPVCIRSKDGQGPVQPIKSLDFRIESRARRLFRDRASRDWLLSGRNK